MIGGATLEAGGAPAVTPAPTGSAPDPTGLETVAQPLLETGDGQDR